MWHGKTGGMAVSGTVRDSHSSVIGGRVMAHHQLRAPELTRDSECVSSGSTTSALVWLAV